MLNSVLYVIVFLVALVISNIINKVFPKIPLPLIQVLMGLILGFFGASKIITVDPEVFLAFIIGPLLFREAEEADVLSIFKYTKLIIVLIFPLVFITALGIGYLTHRLYTEIPLAAAFALGGALAPTDAVAVSSLSERFVFPKSIKNILKGEGMLNDASGIIAFQIALTALVTGYFSVIDASRDLLISAAGGLLVGIILVWLKKLLLNILEDVAIQDIPGYLMIELLLPLLAFLAADFLHVSGIIAVVVTGILSSNGVRRASLFDAQMTQVTNTIWSTLSFILNAVVFLFLGIELYQLVFPLIQSPVYSTTWLLFISISLTIALFVIRFLILSLAFVIRGIRSHHSYSKSFKDLLILTFSGSKGTVSIAAILLIPASATATHSLLVFFCTAVTTLSFLAGMLLLPLFAKKKVTNANNLTRISILAEVVAELEQDMKSRQSDDNLGYIMTVDTYQERIKTLIIDQESFSTDYNDLKLLIMEVENEGLEIALHDGKISETAYRLYQHYLRSLEQSIVYHLVSSVRILFFLFGRMINNFIHSLLRIDSIFQKKDFKLTESVKNEISELYFNNTVLILQALENLQDIYDEQLINFLQLDRLRSAKVVHLIGLRRTETATNLTELMRGYYLERKIIFEYESENKLNPEEAMRLRKNVNTMEDYSIWTSQDTNFIVSFLTNPKNKIS
ncbi:MAG: sodium:proton antiporter [Streptococcaceae bacterium]|jgi:CPA1 family monovalent cation:H+ antiporter|nr:sodium:proton antiporter [Streptococcaceae bacterium]